MTVRPHFCIGLSYRSLICIILLFCHNLIKASIRFLFQIITRSYIWMKCANFHIHWNQRSFDKNILYTLNIIFVWSFNEMYISRCLFSTLCILPRTHHISRSELAVKLKPISLLRHRGFDEVPSPCRDLALSVVVVYVYLFICDVELPPCNIPVCYHFLVTVVLLNDFLHQTLFLSI